MKIFDIFKKIGKITSLFDKKEKRNYYLLLVLIIITAVFEMFGVGAISPLMSLATNPDEVISNYSIVAKFSEITGLEGNNLVYAAGFTFVGIIIFKNILSLFTYIMTSYFSSHMNKTFSIKLMSNFLSMDYAWFLNKNSSDFPRLIIQETKILTRFIIHKSLVIFVNVFMIIAMVTLVALQDIKISLISMGFLGLLFGGLHLFVKGKLKRLGKERFGMDKMKFKIMNDTFGGIKDVKVYGCEKYYVENFYKLNHKFANNTVKSDLYKNLTKYFVEALFFSFFGLLIVFLVYTNRDITSLIPTLSMYLFAAYKIMPALQKVSEGVNTIMSYSETFKILKKDLHKDLILPDATNLEKLNFTEVIDLNNISYTYAGKESPVINNMDLQIRCGEKIGIVGGSGSGKTTLLNIILGLLEPQKGEFSVDRTPINKDTLLKWRKNIGLVSQDIFLFDGTIAENIAFTMHRELIDFDLLEEAAKSAEMLDFVNTLPGKFDTSVGDRGVQISGGQAQRIAIARALYRNPQLLIMDEATSAMDNITESAIMESIDKLTGKKTIIIVAHRLTTVKNCDRILFFKDGEISADGTYDELITNNKDFQELSLMNDQES